VTVDLPRLLIAGVSSGVGKTTFTLGLCRALMRRGLGVSVFKCGPDYLDPTYHRVASKRSVHNLDSWLMDENALRDTFVRNAADISLIEGVMGLFDGASPTELTGSSAEIASLLGAPVVLVCDASGMARSVAALAHGFANFEANTRVHGLICNRVGSAGHLALLKQACTEVPVLGGLRKDQTLRFPERHLGLHTADQLDLEPMLEAWAERVEAECDVNALIACARSAAPLAISEVPALAEARSCRIGIAHDEAFHFYYDANLRLLEQAGAELVRFSPVHDRVFPALDGVVLGGGYPELYAPQLSSNQAMIAGLRALAASGKPIYAECGGLMYLSQTIVTREGVEHPMVGLIEGRAVMCDRLQALGYVEVQTNVPSPLGPAGTAFRGHQFRYSRWEGGSEPTRYALRIKRNGAQLSEGYGQANVLASYVHAHWASNPSVAAAFATACRKG
jgi:cobyrinic acid a,c-diamide synthase